MHLSADRLSKSRILQYLWVFLLGALCLFAAQTAWTRMTSCHETYDLLNPTLLCADVITQGEWDYEPLRDELARKKFELKAAGKLSHISIYFRDLNHGPRFGIGEYDKFQPASLVKLPVMIAFLHEADRNPEILNQTLSYTGAIKTSQNIDGSDETIKPDTPYSIRELLRKMIVYSDNYSSLLLVHTLNATPPPMAYHTFKDLDVLSMMLAPEADEVSIQSYANLFAILYNTGYLSKTSSQFALDLLSQTTFKDALVAGVPQNVRVAHKFGYRILSETESQLHDCGIVYHPATSYVLCVMTSGRDLGTEESVIADISMLVYNTISSLHLNNARG